MPPEDLQNGFLPEMPGLQKALFGSVWSMGRGKEWTFHMAFRKMKNSRCDDAWEMESFYRNSYLCYNMKITQGHCHPEPPWCTAVHMRKAGWSHHCLQTIHIRHGIWKNRNCGHGLPHGLWLCKQKVWKDIFPGRLAGLLRLYRCFHHWPLWSLTDPGSGQAGCPDMQEETLLHYKPAE